MPGRANTSSGGIPKYVFTHDIASGTGKELIARSIHESSTRSNHPFIKVNCAAVPHDLFESEFFGHVRGAFTGALNDRAGRFQLADRGTILLDEVGEVPLALQGKLLRILQEGCFERIGDEKTSRVSVRIIAATNQNLPDDVKNGRFRQDLYYRLAVFPVKVPALRHRLEDILPLAQHFIEKICRQMGMPRLMLTKQQLQTLKNYDWPGNVRELQNAIERGIIISRDRKLNFDFLPKAQASGLDDTMWDTEHALINLSNKGAGLRIIKEKQWAAMQRQNILGALRKSQWKIQGEGGAAELLGLKATTLRSRIKAFNISKENTRSAIHGENN